MWFYKQVGATFQVGYFDPVAVAWVPEPEASNPYPVAKTAAWRCHYLNGGSKRDPRT